MNACRPRIAVLVVALFTALAALATTLPPEEPPAPLKPIDQLITAAGIYKHDLAIMDLDTREITWITDDYTIEQEPCWSPDGKYILYSAIDDAWHELRLLSLETGEKKTLLAEEGVSLISPKWCAAQGKLTFVKFAGRDRKLMLADITPEGISNVVDTGVTGFEPAWDGDGEVYFTGMAPTERMAELSAPAPPGSQPRKFLVQSLDTSENPPRAKDHEMDLPHYCSQPACDDKGKTLAFRANTIGLGDIFVKTTWKMIQVTDTLYDESYPALSPNGKQVYYASDRTGAYQVYKSDLKGNEECITENDMFDFTDLVLSPDGKKLAFKTVTVPEANALQDGSNAERHSVFPGKYHYWNKTQLLRFGNATRWRINHQIGSLLLGKHGEITVISHGTSGVGDLAACRDIRGLVLFALNRELAYPYCRINPNGIIKVHRDVVENFALSIPDTPEYSAWTYFEDGQLKLPDIGEMVIPESSQQMDDNVTATGWAIQLSDGSWMGGSPEIRPLPGSILFQRTNSGGLEVVTYPVDGESTAVFNVQSDRSVVVYDNERFSHLLRWPYVNQENMVWPIPPLRTFSAGSQQFQTPTIYNTETGKTTTPLVDIDAISGEFTNSVHIKLGGD